MPPEWVFTLSNDEAAQPECWPPKSSSPYDWERPTHEIYHDPEKTDFAPTFSEPRSRLDYTYHRNPVESRQNLQDAILSRVVEATATTSSSSDRHQHLPWIVFTAGAMGVGKGYVLTTLHRRNLFPLDKFLKIDPDMIKAELPEMAGYLRTDPETAATKVHRESTHMADVLFEYALHHRSSTLVDGSLRDVEYYRTLLRRIKNEYPEYRIGILHVTAKREDVHARARMRGEATGRVVPTELLDASIEQVPRSVKALAPLTDVTFEISNDEGMPLRLVRLPSGDGARVESNPSWEEFAQTWEEEEEEGEHHDDHGEADEEQKVGEGTEKVCKLEVVVCDMLSSLHLGGETHAAACSVWSKAYPNFCAGCHLGLDSQCGVCVHGRKLCGCEECARVCPVRAKLRQCATSSKIVASTKRMLIHCPLHKSQ